MRNKAIFKYFLDKTLFLSSYILMGVSFLYTILDLFGFVLYKDRWANFGGFSIVTSIVFIRQFYFGDYCWLTRHLPFALFAISSVNILVTFFPEKYNSYCAWYEIIIFSVTLLIASVLVLNKIINKRHNK